MPHDNRPLVSKAKRDPRVEPRPGDILRRNELTRKVVEVKKHAIVVWMWPPYLAHHYSWMHNWKRWAENAEVVKRG
jgi:hypothetical protein